MNVRQRAVSSITPVLRRINIPMVWIPVGYFIIAVSVEKRPPPKLGDGLLIEWGLGCKAPFINLRQISDMHVTANKALNMVPLHIAPIRLTGHTFLND